MDIKKFDIWSGSDGYRMMIATVLFLFGVLFLYIIWLTTWKVIWNEHHFVLIE